MGGVLEVCGVFITLGKLIGLLFFILSPLPPLYFVFEN